MVLQRLVTDYSVLPWLVKLSAFRIAAAMGGICGVTGAGETTRSYCGLRQVRLRAFATAVEGSSFVSWLLIDGHADELVRA